MPDGQVRGMPSPTRSVKTTAGGVVLPHRLYNPLGTEVWSDEFDSATIDSGWTRVDNTGTSGHSTWTQANGLMSYKHNTTADSGPIGHYLLYDISSLITSPPMCIESRARGIHARNASYLMLGLAFADGTTYGAGKQIVYMPYMHSSSGSSLAQSVREFSNFNSQGSSWNGSIYASAFSPHYQRLTWVSSNTWKVQWSADGISWLGSGNQGSWTCTPTHVGFYLSNWSGAYSHTAGYDYIRVYDTDPPTGEVKDTL